MAKWTIQSKTASGDVEAKYGIIREASESYRWLIGNSVQRFLWYARRYEWTIEKEVRGPIEQPIDPLVEDPWRDASLRDRKDAAPPIPPIPPVVRGTK